MLQSSKKSFKINRDLNKGYGSFAAVSAAEGPFSYVTKCISKKLKNFFIFSVFFQTGIVR